MSDPLAFYDVAELVRDCVCDQMSALTEDMAELGLVYGCPCRSYVSPSTPAFDNCCEDGCSGDEIHGQLTVNIVDVFPSDNFPSASNFIFPCAPAAHVVSLLVSVARCAPTMDEHGIPPTPESLDTVAKIAAIDIWAVTTALQCCVTQNPSPGKRKRRVQIAAAGTASAPTLGGCAGIEIRAFVDAGPVCGCPTEVS